MNAAEIADNRRQLKEAKREAKVYAEMLRRIEAAKKAAKTTIADKGN